MTQEKIDFIIKLFNEEYYIRLRNVSSRYVYIKGPKTNGELKKVVEASNDYIWFQKIGPQIEIMNIAELLCYHLYFGEEEIE